MSNAWEVGMDDGTEGDFVPFIEINMPLSNGGSEKIAEVVAELNYETDAFEITEEVRRRADLIAAAPELLASLTDILKRFQDTIGIGGKIEGDEEAIQAAKAAIAKAEGK